MRLIIFLVFAIFFFMVNINAQEDIVSSLTTDCPDGFEGQNINLARDGYSSTYFMNDNSEDCSFAVVCELTRTIYAAKVTIEGSTDLKIGNYYLTQGGEEVFYYIVPEGATSITLTGLNLDGLYKLNEIKVEEVPINLAYMPFSYDANGNITRRTIILSVSPAQKSADGNDFEEKTIENGRINIFPNPTKGMLGIGIADYSDDEEVSIIVYNSDGKVIQTENILQDFTQIDLSDKPAGVYLMNISLNGILQNWKIVKE